MKMLLINVLLTLFIVVLSIRLFLVALVIAVIRWNSAPLYRTAMKTRMALDIVWDN